MFRERNHDYNQNLKYLHCRPFGVRKSYLRSNFRGAGIPGSAGQVQGVCRKERESVSTTCALQNNRNDGVAASNRIRKSTSDTRGSALLIAIALVAILSIGSGVVYKSLHRALSEHSRFERDMIMSHLADAAIDRTLATLRVDPEKALGESSLALGGGMAHIEVYNDSMPHQYRIRVRTELRDGVVVRARAAYSAAVRIAPDELPMLTAWQREKEQQ